VVEAVSGGSYGEYLRTAFFGPMDLPSARNGADPGALASFAQPRGYGPPPSGRRLFPVTTGLAHVGASTIVISARDLALWARALARGDLGVVRESGGPLSNWALSDFEGRRVLSATGYNPGAGASVHAFPDDDLVVVLLTCLDNRRWTAWGDAATRLALGLDVAPDQSGPVANEPVDARAAAQAVGGYEMVSSSASGPPEPPLRIAFENGGLYLYGSSWPIPHYLSQTAPDSYEVEGFFPGVVTFLRDGRHAVSGMRWIRPQMFGPGDDTRMEFRCARQGRLTLLLELLQTDDVASVLAAKARARRPAMRKSSVRRSWKPSRTRSC